MKNKFVKLAVAVAAFAVTTASLQATPIVGSVGFTGTYTQNGGTLGDLTTATSFSINNVLILSATGQFAGATTPTFASPISVNPANSLIPNVQLWSVVVGSTTYKFLVSTETESLDTATQLNLTGSGVMTDGNAADNTAGTWQLGFGVSGASFTWQATTANSVPDGGTTVLLLGAALSGLALVKRKLAA